MSWTMAEHSNVSADAVVETVNDQQNIVTVKRLIILFPHVDSRVVISVVPRYEVTRFY
jgi:hypothetical protein